MFKMCLSNLKKKTFCRTNHRGVLLPMLLYVWNQNLIKAIKILKMKNLMK